ILSMSPGENLTISSLGAITRGGWIDRRRERALVKAQSERLRIRNGTTSAPVSTLSGGNQQKVVMAKWLARDCEVLILDEPTRGGRTVARQAPATAERVGIAVRNLRPDGASDARPERRRSAPAEVPRRSR